MLKCNRCNWSLSLALQGQFGAARILNSGIQLNVLSLARPYLCHSGGSAPSECWCWPWTTAACSCGTGCLYPSSFHPDLPSSNSASELLLVCHCQSSRSSGHPAHPSPWTHGFLGGWRVWRLPCRCNGGNVSLTIIKAHSRFNLASPYSSASLLHSFFVFFFLLCCWVSDKQDWVSNSFRSAVVERVLK